MLSQPSCLATLAACSMSQCFLEAPVDDGLLDSAIFHGTLRGWRILGVGLAPECCHAEHGRARGLPEQSPAATPSRPVIRLRRSGGSSCLPSEFRGVFDAQC